AVRIAPAIDVNIRALIVIVTRSLTTEGTTRRVISLLSIASPRTPPFDTSQE
ncbi:hypothetical protein ACLOJK_038446, partial [Asimina triloba]